MDGNGTKKKWTLKRVGTVCFVLGIILIGIEMVVNDKVTENLDQYPIISTKEQLKDAMTDETHTYRLVNVTASGTPCEDPLGLLADDYLYVEYRAFKYSRDSYWIFNIDEAFDRSWKIESDLCEYGATDRIYLFGDIPLEPVDFDVNTKRLANLDEKFVSYYPGRVYNSDEYFSYYYPDNEGIADDFMRYEVYGIPNNSGISLIADVGYGKVVPSNVQGQKPAISGGGDLSDLEYEATNEIIIALGTLGLLVFFPAGFIMLLIVFIRYLKEKQRESRTVN